VADLTTNFASGIRCPNPFWLESGPPANCGDQVMRAFDSGWGGAVWKTLGGPTPNVSSRYSSVDWNGSRMMGLNNIELITGRPLDVNLREISEVKKLYPHHAVIASLMVESKRETWHERARHGQRSIHFALTGGHCGPFLVSFDALSPSGDPSRCQSCKAEPLAS
jgi:dihydropyrimidine dehydrogenase (NAD+) subunit PreA